MNTPFYVVIPARFASSRLPGKPLCDIKGKPMIQHVYECAVASGAEQVVVATDDQRVCSAVADFGGQASMTAESHPSGSDRVCEVINQKGWPKNSIVVNLQGDEPMMSPILIRQAAEALESPTLPEVATLCEGLTSYRELADPSVVKVVTDRHNYALYFSRFGIPANRNHLLQGKQPQLELHRRHIGLYAYRAGFLRRYVTWPPCILERTEALEQLRILWNGERIYVVEATEPTGPGVDTKEDLQRVRQLFGDTCQETATK